VNRRRADSLMLVTGVVRDLGGERKLKHVDFVLDLDQPMPPTERLPPDVPPMIERQEFRFDLLDHFHSIDGLAADVRTLIPVPPRPSHAR
jgi:hypothetical protein